MDKHDPRHSDFGSAVRRLETAEHRQKRRRGERWAALLGIAMSLAALWLGVDAIRTGELVAGGRGYPPLPGEWVCAMGAFILVLSVWILWRQFNDRR